MYSSARVRSQIKLRDQLRLIKREGFKKRNLSDLGGGGVTDGHWSDRKINQVITRYSGRISRLFRDLMRFHTIYFYFLKGGGFCWHLKAIFIFYKLFLGKDMTMLLET